MPSSAVKLLFLTFTVGLFSCQNKLMGGFGKIEVPFEPSGKLDTSFAGSGFTTIDNTAGGSSHDVGNSVVVDSQNRIIVAGFSTNGSTDRDMVVWRFLPDGTLDSSFGSGGYFIHNSAAGGNSDDEAYGVALDSVENIYVTGYSTNSTPREVLAIWKLTSAGALDTSFNSTGFVTYIPGGGTGSSEGERGRSITIDASGRIVVFGQGQDNDDKDSKVWRYLATGTLDTSFNGDGEFAVHGSAGGNGSDRFMGGAINSTGDIFGVGYSWSGPTDGHDMIAVKIDSSGNISTGFNSTGTFSENGAAGGNDTDRAVVAAVDESQRLLAAGSSRDGSSNTDAVIWRLTTSGTLDSSFNSGSPVVLGNIAGGDGAEEIKGLLVSSSTGAIYVTGYSAGASDDEVFVTKLNDDGSLDTNFGTDGTTIFTGSNGNDSANAMAFDNDGKIIVVGKIANGTDADLAIWRIE